MLKASDILGMDGYVEDGKKPNRLPLTIEEWKEERLGKFCALHRKNPIKTLEKWV
jgi:hypothetical protein